MTVSMSTPMGTERRHAARDHLWMHFARHGAGAPPIIVRGEGCRIVDADGPVLPGRARGPVHRAGRARPPRAGRGGRPAGGGAGVLPALVLRAPGRDRPGRAARPLRARRPQPGLLHQRRWRGRRVGVEARQAVLQDHRQAVEDQGDQPRRSPTTAPRRARSRSPASPSTARRSSRSCPGRSRCPTPTPTARRTTSRGRRSGCGRPTASRRRSSPRAPTRSPRCSSSPSRTRAAASRRRPATSSGSARSAPATTCCWSPTR